MSDPSPEPGIEGVPRPGDVLAGKYRVERVLGAGGMGVVVAALHLQLGERVALKFLLSTMTSAEALARFSREARAAAKIKSEHVARVTDVGTLDSGAPYMVMEYLEGSDLGAFIAEKGALPVRDAVEYVLQACEAVAEAHTLGIVHRDLKPANLFLARRGGRAPSVKVLDFGISKIRQREPSLPPEDPSLGMTRTRAWLGSPLYMSPEQMRSARDVDGRADVWALGVILFELLTAKVPFDGETFPELCAQILHGDPTPLVEARPDAPPGLGAVVRRCLEKVPEQRYQNIGELVLALATFAPRRALPVAERAVSLMEAAGMMSSGAPRSPLDGTLPEPVLSPFRDSATGYPAATRAPSTAPPPPSQSARTPALVATGPESDFSTTARPPSGGATRALVAAAGAIALLAGGALYYFRTRQPPVEPIAAEQASATAVSTATAAAPPEASATSAPTVTIAPSATASVTASVDAGAAPIDAGAARVPPRDAGLAGRLPVTPSTPTASAVAPKPSSAPEAPPAPPHGGDLGSELCWVSMPDGSKKVVPCQ